MKNTDINALKKILAAFEKHVSEQEQLLNKFRAILDGECNAKKKQGYQRNPEYYKASVRECEKSNPEKAKGYQKRYYEKKKAERLSNILDLLNQGKTVPEISPLLNISEKTIRNCLAQNENNHSDGNKEES